MKSFTLVSLAAFAGLVLAQDASISSCGQMCVDNMKNLYKELGCASKDDMACLCKNPDYTHGLRDCTNQACKGENADAVIAAGTKNCNAGSSPKSGSESSGTEGGASKTGGAGVAGAATSGAGSQSNGATPTGGESKSGATSTPYTTEAIVSTITTGSGAPVTTTVGSTTLYTMPGSSDSASSSGSSGSSGASPSASGSATESGSGSSPTESGGNGGSGGSSNKAGGNSEPSSSNTAGAATTSSSGSGAPTMGPVGHGVAGAIGLVALFAL